MKDDDYYQIVAKIRKFKGLSKECIVMLRTKYTNVPINTLYSILSLEIQERMKHMHGRLFGPKAQYYEKYLEAVERQEPVGILLRMARDINAAPALLAKNVLTKHYKNSSANKSKNVKNCIKDATYIEDRDLAYEVHLCTLYDDQYGPIGHAIGSSVGQEYELKLQNALIEKKIPFLNEDQLRIKGYDKTPDVKLEVPIAVNGFIINWIESKARFASQDVHKKYMHEQYFSYWNRFGPGLVIYWFGYVDSISESMETKFIMMDHFPEEIVCMQPKLIQPETDF